METANSIHYAFTVRPRLSFRQMASYLITPEPSGGATVQYPTFGQEITSRRWLHAVKAIIWATLPVLAFATLVGV